MLNAYREKIPIYSEVEKMSFLKQLQSTLALQDQITDKKLLEKIFDTCAYIIYLNKDHFLYVFHDDYNNYLEILEKLQKILKETSTKEIDIKTRKKYEKTFLLTEAIFLIKSEKYNQAEEKLDKFLVINKKYDHRLGLAHYNLLIANILNVKGNKTQATEFLQVGLELFKEHGNPESYAHTLLHLANWYYALGDYQKSKNYYSECYTYSQEGLGLAITKALAVLGLGGYYKNIGKLKEARKCFLESLQIKNDNEEIFAKNHIKNFEKWPYAHLGEINLLLGFEDQAITHFKQILSFSKQENDIYSEARNYLNLITVYATSQPKKYETGYFQEAKKYLELLDELNRSTGRKKVINTFYKMAAGIYYMNISGENNKEKAMVFFEQVIKDQTVVKIKRITALKLQAQLHLSLIEDNSDQKQLLKDTQALISEMKELLKNFNNNALIADAMFLEAKLALSTFNLEKGIALLNETKQFVQNLNLKQLNQEINIEFNKLLKSTSKFGYKTLLLLKLYNELNLTEITKLLQISKTATLKHLSMLENLGLITVSKQEQIRSKKNKVKYYQLTESGNKVFQNFTSTDDIETHSFQPILSLRIFNILFDNLENYLDPNESKTEKNAVEITQHYLTDDQYKEYSKLAQEFNDKVTKLFSQEKRIKKEESQQKKKYAILNFKIPITELIHSDK